ncbi:MAG: hypothetical protein AAFR17_11100 [Pseudomonadota bacterium]
MSASDDFDYVSAWVGLNSTLVQLWSMFAAGNFAACAVVATQSDMSSVTQIALSGGYFFFAFGNFLLVRQKLRILERLRDAVEAQDTPQIWRIFAASTNKVIYSLIFHWLVQAAVQAIIWHELIAGLSWGRP